MPLPTFRLERFFAQYEFKAPYLMCCSDCEAFTVQEILSLEPTAEAGLKELWLGYTESRGNPELRDEICKLYQHISPQEILVHTGAEEAIFNFMQVALNPGDHVIVQSPCYQSLFAVAQAIGCEVTKWVMRPEESGWTLPIDDLKAAVKENTKAIIINSPHNPTGFLLSHRELDEIIETARPKNILLFADEVYKYLEYDADDTLPWACDLYENAISLGVMSKSFGLPGLRIGWIATKNPLIYQAMAAFKDYTTICNSAPSEFLALIALRHKKQLVHRNLDIINKNLALLDDFFLKYRHLFTWYRPKAGPIAFPKINGAQKMSEIIADLVEKKGVLLLPGKLYDFGDKFFRVGYGRKNLPTCLDRFEEYIMANLG